MLDGPSFVNAVMARLGAANAADLAEKMHWKRGTERLVAKWLAGNNRPSYRYMLEMIERAGLIDMGGVKEPFEELPVAVVDRSDLAALERRLTVRLEEVAATTLEGFQYLRDGIADVARRLPDEGLQDTGEGEPQ